VCVCVCVCVCVAGGDCHDNNGRGGIGRRVVYRGSRERR
jgi:hypothetical protein